MATKKKVVKQKVQKVEFELFEEISLERAKLRILYENEKVARECSERQNTILSEIQKDYVRLSGEMGEVGLLMQQHYSEEMGRNEHQGQTLAQVLWRYLKVERENRVMVKTLEDAGAVVLVVSQGASQNKLKPWLARLARWFA